MRSHSLGRRAATTSHRTVCPCHAHALVAMPALWRPHALVERLTARQLFLEALLVDIGYDSS